MEPMLNIALRAARKAGNTIARATEDLDRLDVSRKSANDFVSEVDIAAEREIIYHLKKAYPEHSILAEESGETIGSDPDYRCIRFPVERRSGLEPYVDRGCCGRCRCGVDVRIAACRVDSSTVRGEIPDDYLGDPSGSRNNVASVDDKPDHVLSALRHGSSDVPGTSANRSVDRCSSVVRAPARAFIFDAGCISLARNGFISLIRTAVHERQQR